MQTTPPPVPQTSSSKRDSKVIEWVRHMPGKDGKDFLSVGTTDSGYLARYANVADFLIHTKDESVHWTVTNRAFRQALSPAVHLGKNQVLPMLLARREVLVLHASACVLPNGRILAFSGPSGIGKSTLAQAASQLNGVQQLADDWIAITPKAETADAFAYSEDVAEAIATPAPEDGVPKAKRVAPRHQFALNHLNSFRTETFPLQAIYMLEKGSADETVQIAPINAKARFVNLVQNLFRLDSRHRLQLQKELQLLSRLLETTPIYSLRYPRRKRDLPELALTVTSHSSAAS